MIDKTRDDLAVFGAPAEILREKEEERFEVWPENWAALQMFLRVQTQWVVGMNGVVGLNYSSLETAFRIYKVKDHRRMLNKIRLIELGVLDAQRKQNQIEEERRGAKLSSRS